jgi:TFIIF-interacting CTD phosphatase-like protein
MMKKLVILDIDETICYVTTNEAEISRKPCHIMIFDSALEKGTRYHLYSRPDLSAFLDFLREHFKVAVWTASDQDYCDAVVERLFPTGYPLLFQWAFPRCSIIRPRDPHHPYPRQLLKRLQKVKQKYRIPLEHMLMIDNTPSKLLENYGNLIPVVDYRGSQNDTELRLLSSYLMRLKSVPNVRTLEKRDWREKSLDLTGFF